MPRIRTDAYALFLAFLFAGAFMFGHLKLGMLDLPDPLRTYDRLLIWLVAGSAMYVGLFALGHFAMRGRNVGERWAYAVWGGVSLVAMYLCFKGPARLAVVFGSGQGVIGLIIPFAIGAAFGFLYAWRAGWEVDDAEDLDGLRARMVGVTSEQEANMDAFSQGGVDYFGGPLRVRTSIPLMLLAAVLGGVIFGVARGAFRLVWEVTLVPDPSATAAVTQAATMANYVGFEMLAMAIIGAVPTAVCILAAHYVLRGLKRTEAWVGAGVGLLTPLVLGILWPPLYLMTVLVLAIPTALGMAIYRSFAGLEPVPVKDDVIARRSRDLVGADHPRRRFARVIRAR